MSATDFINLLLIQNNMQTIKYQLESDPNKTISIPQEYAKEAEKIVLVSLFSEDSNQFRKSFLQHSCSGNMGILAKAVSLANNPYSSELKDELYLRVCMFYNESAIYIEKTVEESNREELVKLDRILLQTIRYLEQKQK